MKFEIRKMCKSDLGAVLEIQKKSFTDDLLETFEVFNNRFERFGEHFLTVFDDNDIVGYVICFPWKLGEIPKNNEVFDLNLPQSDSYYIHDICLLESTRGKGIAKELLDYIFKKMEELHYKKVSLVSVEQAGNYWLKNGFINLAVDDEVKLKLRKSYGKNARILYKEI